MIPAYHAAYVVDASVAVKWFCDESQSETARGLLGHYRAGRCRLSVPGWLFFLEIGSALSKKGFTEEAVAGVLENLWHYRMDSVEVKWDVLSKANAISFGYRTSIYDSAYVSLAENTGFPLVTADEELLRRMKGHSIVLPVWELEFAP